MDSRFHLNVDFEIYGEKFHWDCCLNWSSIRSDEIDPRITEWFLRCHETAYDKYQARMIEHRRDQDAFEKRSREIAELKRLREKYPHE